MDTLHKAPKILVIMSDSRSPETEKDLAGYYSLVAFINAIYCSRQGYDFIYYQTPPINTWEALFSNFWRIFWMTLRNEPRTKKEKMKACCYNKLLKEYRAAPWAKLIALKEALLLNYPTVVYIDSDCIFLNQNMKIEEFAEKMPIQTGSPFKHACAGFLKNAPWDEKTPCSGFLIMKNCQESLSFLSEWWNFRNSSRNFKHEYEQSSLCQIFDRWADRLCVWDSLFFIDDKGQFLRHRHCFEHEIRRPYFLKIVNDLEASSKQSFKDVMTRINVRCLPSFPAW